MDWLITGGCGFVGSNLADTLLSKGQGVIIVDNLSRLGSRENLRWLRETHGQEWMFVQDDIRNADAILKLVNDQKPDVIAHLAGQVAMTTSVENPRLDFEINALGTLNVLEAVRTCKPDTIVLYSSTNKVYGSLEELRYVEGVTRYELPDHPSGLDESLPLDAHSPYGCSKLTGDQYVRDYSRIFGIPTVVFRHSSMYGGRQFATYDQGWIGWFCQKALEMENAASPEFTISGNGKQVRDVLHAHDLVEVYQQAVRNISRTAGQIYNIGGGMQNSLSLVELFAVLEQLTGYPLRFKQLDWRSGDQKVFVADTRKAHRDFLWSPKMDKEQGIRQMLEWSKDIYAKRF
jgi:CDP-paratose 2-epimerase